jgi:hypothetical protein
MTPIRIPSLLIALACALPVVGADAVASSSASSETSPAAAPAAAPTTTAEVAVRGWLTAAKAGDYAPLAAALPADLRRMVTPPAPAPADAGNGNQGRAMMARMRGGMLGRIANLDEAGATELAGQLSQMLTLIGDIAAGTAVNPQPQPGQDGMAMIQAMAPRFMATGVVGGLPRAILADGVETRQIAALTGFWAAHAAFAKKADLGAETITAEVAKRLTAFSATLKEAAPPEESEATKAAKGMAGVFHALAAFGLDGEAALAAATVTVESTSPTVTMLVVTFPAYGTTHTLPLKVAWKDNAWRIEADSPLNRWQGGGMGMMGGMGGMPGGFGGQQGRGRRGQNGGGQGAAPEAPATQPQGF